MDAGRFISFEGGEGTGKSTQARRLGARLAEVAGEGDREVVVTREPGGSAGAEEIRALLVSGPAERWSLTTEALLLYAARRDHLERVIRPALERDAWVVCDRFHDSTRAYQGAAGGASPGLLAALENEVLGAARPDLTLVLDLPAHEGLRRAVRRGAPLTRYEARPAEFHARLRAAFLELARQDPRRCVVIDARADEEAVAQAVWVAVVERLGP